MSFLLDFGARARGAARGCPRLVAVALLLASAAACEFGRKRPTQPVLGSLEVRSDPAGASIFLDGRATGSQTPATIDASVGQRDLRLELDMGPEFFLWTGQVSVAETALATVDAALIGGCFLDCPFRLDVNRVGCLVTGVGDFCSLWANPRSPGQNAWPAGSGNEYVFGLRLAVAGIVGSDGGAFEGDTVSSFLYQDMWFGRSPVSVATGNGVRGASYRYWSDPTLPQSTRMWLLGIEADQRAIAPDATAFQELQNVLYFRFRLRNVTADPGYRHWHPELPEGGLTYTQLYAGMMMDVDVGNSDDDAGTYLPGSGVAFLYDLDFQDAELVGGYGTMPPLVGLVGVEPPSQAFRFPFTLWRRGQLAEGGHDWDQDPRTPFDDDLDLGYRLLTAQLRAGDPVDCTAPDDDVGFCDDAPFDYRLALTAGPVDLPPGDSAVWVYALLFGEPVPGTFTPGTAIPPGLPTVSPRPIEAVADTLAARASRARARWLEVWSRAP